MRDAVAKQIRENSIKTIRFSCVDQHGLLRGKTLVADALDAAIERGVAVPSSLFLKDTSGRTVFDVWGADAGFGPGRLTGAGDVLLRPDLSSFRTLPWAPGTGWLLCDLETPDGAPLALSPRHILRQAIDALTAHGYSWICGLELEFHLYRRLEEGLRFDQTNAPGAPGPGPEVAPLTPGYQLLSETVLDAVSPILDKLRETAQGLGLRVRSLELEFGPSQVEMTFEPGEALAQADDLTLFKSMAKQVCARAGYHASFMCKPPFPHSAASGWHIHQSLIDTASGRNAFVPSGQKAPPPAALYWIGGLLAHAAGFSALTNPTVNSYRRFSARQLAPDRIGWAHDNKGALVRALLTPGDAASRIENRIADPSANPYLAFAAQILAGLDGLKRRTEPGAPTETPYDQAAPVLPADLGVALDAFDPASLFAELGAVDFKRYWRRLKGAEWERARDSDAAWERREYFDLY
ncbi:MAG: glutamine synthetase family protein [Alphaproteobacteria bacterium]|nr:glutamine synthetase family protein [Alphaproteobacteria bacterium]